MSIRTLLLLVLFAALTACAQASAPTDSDGATKPKVDRVILAVAAPRREGNEMRHFAGPDSWQLRPMYESLIGIDPNNGALVPQLATEWKLDPNASSIRFKLRQGTPFHDNWGEVTAKDASVAWKEIVKEDSLSGTRPYWVRTLREIEIVNDYEVIFHLTRPDGHFFESVSEARGSFEIHSSAHLANQGPATMQTRPLAGTGPYRYQEREQGSFLRYERAFEKHWRSNPDFPEFEFRWVREPSTRLAALLTGEIHMADLPQDLQPQSVQRGFQVVKGRVPALRTFVEFICCNFADNNDFSKGYAQPDSPMRDRKVRQALSKAVNRDELNKAFFAGKGEPMIVNHFHPSRIGWNPEWERRFQELYDFDQAKARSLLAEAGFGPQNPYGVTMRVAPLAGYSGGEDVTEAIAAAWRSVGVKVDLVNIDEAQWTPQVRAFRLINYATMAATNATQWTGSTIYSTSTGPRAGAEVAEVDTIVKELLGTLDEGKQKELWARLGNAKFEAVHELPLFWLPVEAVVDPKIVADWGYPGSLSGSWSHVDLIRAAR